MRLSIGIVGLPNVGKSTLFQLLTKKQVDIANYPFTTINPNVGVVAMPDERLEAVAEVIGSKKIFPAVFEFVDIAGLVKGAHQGAGLGNQFLAHIREADAIIHLVRVFKDEGVVHFEGELDPIRDMETVLSELKLKDEASKEKAELRRAESRTESSDSGARINLLSTKPQLIFLNGRIEDLPTSLTDEIRAMNYPYLIGDLEEGLGEPDLKNIFHDFLKLLDLVTFFTANENEARSWFVKQETKVPQAGGVVHTDFENKFIKAEVINWKKLVEAGSWQAAKQRGWIRLEGKDSIVEDGDVMEVKHS